MIDLYVHQHTPLENPTFPPGRPAQVALEDVQFLALMWQTSGRTASLEFRTAEELHVLRFLRLIREEVRGVRIPADSLRLHFDKPDGPGHVTILATEDGDLASQVPGGFFAARFNELP